ncbi:MAG: hypothetical protein R2817_05560 [Flavobacteriales bacterium]
MHRSLVWYVWQALEWRRYGVLATGAGAQAWWVAQAYGEPKGTWQLALAIALATLGAYQWVHALLAIGDPRGRGHALMAAVCLLFPSLMLLLPWWSALLSVVPWAFVPFAAYAFPLRQGRGGLRAVPGMKVLLVVWCWIALVVVLPMRAMAGEHVMSALASWLPVQLPLFTGVALLSDLRDRSSDPSTLRTWPQVLGEGWTRLLVVLLFLYVGLIVVLRGYFGYAAYVDGTVPWPEVLVAAGCLFAVGLAVAARITRPGWYFSVLVDGLLLVLPLLYAIGAM